MVFADRYHEWQKSGKEKLPYYMTPVPEPGITNPGFCLVGLWERWVDKDNEETIDSCSILTTDAAPSLAHLHDRMPVVVNRSDYEFWLDTEFSDTSKLKTILQPAADGYFQSTAVSKLVNNVRNDTPECI